MRLKLRSRTRLLLARIRQLLPDPRLRRLLNGLGNLLAGFFLSAGSLLHRPIPLSLALTVTGRGWEAPLRALGSCLGLWTFWQEAGHPAMLWQAGGLTLALILGDRTRLRSDGRLLSLGAAGVTAVTGLFFRLRLNAALPMGIWALQTGLAWGITRLFLRREQSPDPAVAAPVRALWVLALAQGAPVPWLNPGIALGTLTAMSGGLVQGLWAGIALDLCRVSRLSMTGLLGAGALLARLPGLPRWVRPLLPAGCCLVFSALAGESPGPLLPMVLAGGMISLFLPRTTQPETPAGPTGAAQVRLELAAGVLSQVHRQLLEMPEVPPDDRALVLRAAQRACGSCPCRKGCREQQRARELDPGILHGPDPEALELACRRPGRLLGELSRAREHLRALEDARQLREEYRSALLQQLQFLTRFLQDLSDRLSRRLACPRDRFRPQIILCANRREGENGDRLQSFRGTGNLHFVLLCDGLGTGPGAREEAASAGAFLRGLLLAGFPPEHALRSFNSLCALRGLAGAATVDLVQLELDTGRALVFKWGAAESWLLGPGGQEKIGTAGPPPGLSVTEGRETVDRLSLRRGEALVLCSDGVAGEVALDRSYWELRERPGELAARILEAGSCREGDDATVAVIRLSPIP